MPLGITAASLIARGYATAHFQDPSGQEWGSAPLQPDHHPYAPGQPFNQPEYEQRYGVPTSPVLFHPPVFAEFRQVVWPALIIRAWRDGHFERELGVPRSAGDGNPTDEELDDLNFVYYGEELVRVGQKDPKLGALYLKYGPPSVTPETPPPPAKPQPTGVAKLKFPWRSRLETFPEVTDWLTEIAKSVPRLREIVATPGYDQKSAATGEGVLVPADVFLKMYDKFTDKPPA